MKLKILQSSLAKALSISSKFVSNKAQLPILSNIKIKAQDNKLILGATNLEMSISVNLGAQVQTEGEIAIPGRVLTDIIVNLNPTDLTLESKNELLEIKSDDFKSTITGMNTSDFPAIPSKLEKGFLNIKQGLLTQSLSKVLYAVSNDETRPVLNGVLFVFKKDGLEMVATTDSGCLILS